MEYRAIIFDLDGTLLDTLADLAGAANSVLEARGYPTHPLDAFRYFVGNGAPKLIERALPDGAAPELCRQCLEEFKENYRANWNNQTLPYPGVQELLIQASSSDRALAVLSNKVDEFTKMMIAHFFPQTRFRMVQGALDHIPRKPDPLAALAMADELGLEPAEMIFVGDTAVDMQTAVNAGMYPVGASWGFRSRQELKDNGAAKVIDLPLELLDIL